MQVKRIKISGNRYHGEVSFGGTVPKLALVHNGLEAVPCEMGKPSAGSVAFTAELPEVDIGEHRHVFAIVDTTEDEILDVFSFGLDFDETALNALDALRQEVALIKASLRRQAHSD